MGQDETKAVLGIAEYEARWVHRTNMVELTAWGVLPCGNYEAQLEQRPEKVLPPMWDMVFYIQDYCIRCTKPFTCKVHFISTSGAGSVHVRDASGEVEVPIKPALEKDEAEASLEIGAEQNHVVYAKLPRPQSGHYGCLVVPEYTLVTGIHYRAFGPATKRECEQFVMDHCGPFPTDYGFRGGEIPWPLRPNA